MKGASRASFLKAAFGVLAYNSGVTGRMKVSVFVMGFSEFQAPRSTEMPGSWSK